MKILKWSYEAKKYEPTEVPDAWELTLADNNWDKKYHCVNCGKKVLARTMYCSLEYHTPTGVGYGVCPECHEMEYKRRFG